MGKNKDILPNGQKEYYYSIDEFFADLDRVVAPVIALSETKEHHKKEMMDAGLIRESPPPKWMRRKKGERRESDKGYL